MSIVTLTHTAWRAARLTGLVAAILFGSQAARAQEDEEPAPTEEPGAPLGDSSDEASPAGKRSIDPNAPQVSEVHRVASGDTLWDLCSKYLNSPWYWPKIWSYNPQITNPHWIYPGNELRFYPSDENLPTNVEVSSQVNLPQPNDPNAIPGGMADEDIVRTARGTTVGRAIPNAFFAASVGFVSNKAHEGAGEIVNSESEAYMLADYDRIYIKLKSPAKKGENYAIYRVIKEIEHPVTGEPYGYAVGIVGGLTVVDTSPSVATGQIAQSFSPIERGDFVGRWPERFGARVAPSPNQSETQGYIIESVGDTMTELGEHHIVFIDRGRKDGVQQGNTFAIVTRGDRYTAETSGLPNEDIGQAMVIDVQDRSSTAVVTASVHEIYVGDKVEMRRN